MHLFNDIQKSIAEIIQSFSVSNDNVELLNPEEISIELSEDTMRAYGITFAAVADAVRASSIDLPGGAVRTDSYSETQK